MSGIPSYLLVLGAVHVPECAYRRAAMLIASQVQNRGCCIPHLPHWHSRSWFLNMNWKQTSSYKKKCRQQRITKKQKQTLENSSLSPYCAKLRYRTYDEICRGRRKLCCLNVNAHKLTQAGSNWWCSFMCIYVQVPQSVSKSSPWCNRGRRN